MNNEIKEKMTIGKAKKILRGFLAKDCYYDTPLYYAIPYLLDYITNLQEQLHQASLDIQELTERDIECPSWCDKLTNLQQENERLKELCDKYEEEHSNEFQCWKRDRKELLDKRARIEKAVEYIESRAKKARVKLMPREEELLNILNGRSDE